MQLQAHAGIKSKAFNSLNKMLSSEEILLSKKIRANRFFSCYVTLWPSCY